MLPITLRAQGCALNLPTGSVTLSNTAVTYCSVVVSAGATLFIGGSVTMTVTGNVDIEGMVDGIGFGYGSTFTTSAGPGAGGTGTGGNGGGGHGGGGGQGGEYSVNSGGGPSNDNPSNPVLMGSAGGGVSGGGGGFLLSYGAGGAAFLLNAPSGTVSINGTVDMSGAGGGFFGFVGGGAGGTISIQAQAIVFNGTLNAQGGTGGKNSGGGGGGIIVLCSSVNPLSGAGTYSVTGGDGGANGNGILYGGFPGANGLFTSCPLPTPSPTATPSIDVFYVSCNACPPSQQPVSILVATNSYPGAYSLSIYNSAGEHIKTLDSQNLGNPITQSYTWDGTNKYGDSCASGVYIIDLLEPASHRQKKVLLIR